MKIVSLLPSTTEICFALDLADQLAAVTHECDFPEAAQTKPSITRNVLPDGPHDSRTIDQLISQRILEGSSIYEIDLPLLRSIAPRSVDEIIDSIGTVGALTDREAAADAVKQALRRRIEAIGGYVAARSNRESPRVVCLEWLDPPMVGGHWVPEMVELAGGRDILGKLGKPSFRVDWEQVRDARPDVIVLMPCGYHLEETLAEVEQTARQGRFPAFLNELPAVASGRVYAVDGSSYFNRPGPRVVDGIAILATICQPDLPSDLAAAGGFAPVNLRADSRES